MKHAETWTRLIAAILAVVFAMSLSAPSLAQASGTSEEVTLPAVSVSQIHFPATVTSVSPGLVTVNWCGTSIDLPSQFATYTLNDRPVAVSTLEAGQNVEVYYPTFSGTITRLQDNAVFFRTLDGRLVMVPVDSLTPALKSDLVFVKQSDGTYVKVSLNKAIQMQRKEGALIVSSLPAGAEVSSYAAAEDDVMSGYNNNINWAEGVRIQADPSKQVQDQSIDGDSNI